MDDLISRQAAIEALSDYIHNVDKVIGTGKLSKADCRDAAENVLEALPSAQPEIAKRTAETAQNVSKSDLISQKEVIEPHSKESSKTRKALDYISRQEAIDALKDWYNGLAVSSFRGVEKVIKELPSAQPQTGHWIEDEEQHHVETMFHCSECGFSAWGRYEKHKFCGGCGARMENAYEGSD